MTNKFLFKGTTTFIDKPRDTVIQDFQNTYVNGADPDSGKINAQLMKLVELILESGDINDEVKDEATQAIHGVAEQIKNQNENRLTLKGTLQAIKDVVTTATDIAKPALDTIRTVMSLLGLG